MLFEHNDHIVFAGDSVTDAGSAGAVSVPMFDNLGQGYVRLIDSLLAACYPERCIRVTNAGVNGHTSRELLARFDTDVVAQKPDLVSSGVSLTCLPSGSTRSCRMHTRKTWRR